MDHFAISNDKLDGLPSIKKGNLIDCPASNCDKQHEVKNGLELVKGPDGKYGDNPEKRESPHLQYVSCETNDKTYLVGLRERKLD